MLRVFGRKMIIRLTIVVDYFSNILKSNGIIDASAVVAAVQPVVTKSMNRGLVQEFQAAEVVKALKQMHPKKSPSPNGMPPLFLSTLLVFCWKLCYSDCP